MAYRITIGYKQPTDPAAFDRYYTETHLGVASKIPNVQRFVAGHTENPDGSSPQYYQLAEITFASKDAALRALGSPEGQAAAADIANFADNGADLFFSNEEVVAP
jgi:uncharacterized protein (TIGR02118 family)